MDWPKVSSVNFLKKTLTLLFCFLFLWFWIGNGFVCLVIIKKKKTEIKLSYCRRESLRRLYTSLCYY